MEHPAPEFAVASTQALERCIDRLNAIVETETALLKCGEPLDFATLNARKTHTMMEFIQTSRNAGADDFAALSGKVLELRERLASNAELLERHLQATQEIATLVVAGIRKEDSDGTYTIPQVRTR